MDSTCSSAIGVYADFVGGVDGGVSRGHAIAAEEGGILCIIAAVSANMIHDVSGPEPLRNRLFCK